MYVITTNQVYNFKFVTICCLALHSAKKNETKSILKLHLIFNILTSSKDLVLNLIFILL